MAQQTESKRNSAPRPESRGANGRFLPGYSGNPGGMPKSAEGFRARCREVAADMLESIARRAETGSVDHDLADMVKAFEAVADRGGYVTADKLSNDELQRGRLLLAALALESLTPEQRTELIAKWTTAPEPALLGPKEDET